MACPEELLDNRDFLLVIEGAVRRTELLLVLPNRLKLDSVEDGVVAEKHWQNQLGDAAMGRWGALHSYIRNIKQLNRHNQRSYLACH